MSDNFDRQLFLNTYAGKFGIHQRKGPLFFSAVGPEYWKTEFRRLFAIRLARLQMNVVGAAEGLGRDLPEGVNELEEKGQGDARHQTIKVRAQGMKNISVAGLLGFWSLAFTIWLATVKVGETVMLLWFPRRAWRLLWLRCGGFIALSWCQASDPGLRRRGGRLGPYVKS